MPQKPCGMNITRSLGTLAFSAPHCGDSAKWLHNPRLLGDVSSEETWLHKPCLLGVVGTRQHGYLSPSFSEVLDG